MVLHRIEMDVVEVALEVVFVADQVLPEARLPDASPLACLALGADGLFRAAGFEPISRELLLEEGPAPGEVAFAWGERPDRVQMVGK